MRKLLCMATSAIIIASTMCCGVMANDNVSISRSADNVGVYDVFVNGTARPGHTLTVGCELTEGYDSIIKWYRDGSEIANANSTEYTLTKDDAEKNIKAGITPVDSNGATGVEIFSQSVSVAPSLEQCTAKNNTNITDYAENPLEKNNPDYVFSENGYTYAYLAAEENGMYVIADNVAGRVKLTDDPKDNYFNPEDSSTIAYWLNHDYLEGTFGSSGEKINPHVADYLKEREYLTEGSGVSNMATKDDYVVKCKIALPSFYELTNEYSDIIGYNPTGAAYYMIFRTPVYKSGTNCPNLKVDTGVVGSSNVTTADKNYQNLTLRACMLIGYDFFKNYKLDMNMGDEVKAFLRNRFTREEMAQAGYTDDELSQIGYVGSSINTNDFTIAGIRAAGQMLCMDNIREVPDNLNIKYSWYYSETKDGQFKKITSADKKDYVIEHRLTGKYIKSQAEIYNSETDEKYGSVEVVTDVIADAKPLTVMAEGFANSKGTFKVINNTGAETDIYFIVAAFDEDNRMISCTAKTETVVTGESEVNVTVQADNVYIYRLMAWESAESAKMLCGRTIR